MRSVALVLALASSAYAHELFARQSAYPEIDEPGPRPKPEWVATYEAAKRAGKIPSFAPSVLNADGVPKYPRGTDLGEHGVCSWSEVGCYGPDDISAAPDGMWGLNFDDGPLPPAVPLYAFLEQNNQSATHFLMGSNVLKNPDVFTQALSSGAHFAVHTWSHPYMTALDDLGVIGELGWTIQVIFDRSGYIPRFWRPPFGDADARVRAIATEVFGLRLVGWDRDSNDWCTNPGAPAVSCAQKGVTDQAGLERELRGWATGSKSPGPIGLQHENGPHPVNAFINTYPVFIQNGWNAMAVPDLFDEPWYLNAARNGSTIDTSVAIGAGPNTEPLPSASTSEVSSATSASSMVTSTRASSSFSETAPPSNTAVPAREGQDNTENGAATLFASSAFIAALGFGSLLLA
ncbi:hypothetical protein Rhopal_000827-T1 [Rhodotorula paludigena]|uniref:chitin deacetylase n=1 Tax=Rhodotorula paludigena TaxID=86838 RepID=A0AAV5GEV4_9BASI|nr:hypothetical protein Rhopal_000827-T1 [Rhodotorula paludigena]